MLNIVVCVSGGGTNLQAIIDGIDAGRITNTKITGVISNNASAYALERAKKMGYLHFAFLQRIFRKGKNLTRGF